MTRALEAYLAIIWGIACGALIGFMAGSGLTEDSYQRKAVELGCAEWVVNVDGSTQFKWKEIQ